MEDYATDDVDTAGAADTAPSANAHKLEKQLAQLP